ncbi:tyrosine-type recombinase/integrase [Saccharopolyspora sp. 5N708]|uniref:tyrosine-type recombinase/integrase n=1 Tax=Saccharopolyspora sp. 5N708 TaxID=3457424 RepID=UPI003FD58E87
MAIKLPPIPPSDEYFLTQEEYVRIYQALPTRRDKMLVALLVNTGIRWGEAVGAHRHRLDASELRLDVHEVYDERAKEIKPYPKGRKRQHAKKRSVPLSDGFAEDLAAWLEDRPNPKTCRTPHRQGSRCRSGLIVPGYKEAVVDYHNWRREVWVPAVTAAGLPTVRIHDLRHTYASWLIQSGKVTIEQLQILLGHALLSTTQRYAHLARSQWESVRSSLSDSAACVEQGKSERQAAPYLLHADPLAGGTNVIDLASRRRSAG